VDAVDFDFYSSNVILDLHGHTVSGPGNVTGYNGSGIYDQFGATDYDAVINNTGTGKVQNFPLYGVSLGGNADVENLSVTNNGFAGIDVGSYSRVIGNTTTSNGGGPLYSTLPGISTANDCLIYGNFANSNAGDGIDTPGSTAGSNVDTNQAESNGGYGLDLGGTYTGFGGNTIGDTTGTGANTLGCVLPDPGKGNAPYAVSMLTNTCGVHTGYGPDQP